MANLETNREQVAITGLETEAFKIGYGTYHLLHKINASDALDSFGQAFEAGVNLYDSSDNYGSELAIGRAVSAGILPRDKVIITTKTGLGTTISEQQAWTTAGRRSNTSPERIRTQVDNSLRVFGDDVGPIDIYQLHVRDPEVEHVAHAEVMADLIEAGKIRTWGVSNYSNQDLQALLAVCDEHGLARPATSQPFHNMLDSDSPNDVRFARAQGLTVLAHSPLSKGVLTNSGMLQLRKKLDELYAQGDQQQNKVIEAIQPVFEDLIEVSRQAGLQELTMAQAAIAWTLQEPDLVTLTTPTNPRYLNEALGALRTAIGPELDRAIDKLRAQPNLRVLQNAGLQLIRPIKGY